MLLKSKTLLLAFLILPVLCFSQHSHKAGLQKVNKSGFYSIPINPELSSLLDASLNDLRIINETGDHIPYVVDRTIPISSHAFKTFPIIDNSVKDSGTTHIVIEPTSSKISSVILIIRNAAVSRTASLSGSDNMKNWFTIAEDILLAPSASDKNDRFALNLSFPVSSYKYLRLVINNGKNDPLHILEAGTIISNTEISATKYLNNPEVAFVQTDSTDKVSYIKIRQDKPYHIDRIILRLKGPPFFKRYIELNTGESTSEFMVNSKTEFALFSPTIHKQQLVLKIYNGDNPPLKILSVETAQEEKRVVAYLEKEQEYSLLLNDPSSSTPVYDLLQFKDSIPQNVASVQVLAIGKIAESIEKDNGSNTTYLWIIIVLVLGVLSYFTWNLTKEVSKKH